MNPPVCESTYTYSRIKQYSTKSRKYDILPFLNLKTSMYALVSSYLRKPTLQVNVGIFTSRHHYYLFLDFQPSETCTTI